MKKQNICRVNFTEEVVIKNIFIVQKSISIQFHHKNRSLDTKSIKSFWYRHGTLLKESDRLFAMKKDINWYLKEEAKATEVFFMEELDKKARINRMTDGELNKLSQLSCAISCGLKVPETLLASTKTDVLSFFKRSKQIITKSIQVPLNISKNNKRYLLLTALFDATDLRKTSANFLITKFQRQIKKQLELRIFYLNGIFYSMAIFSQRNPKTRLDFRNYDNAHPNRTVPYLLPFHIKKKLKELMKRMRLLSGSIDMIVDDKNEYYFLEINPVGQFGMVSFPCNYYLEQKIAALLIKQ